jgi:large subunit GTPase 1
MSAAELDRLEKEAFLAWRREIAEAEEASGNTLKVTPFEKNLEVWRQLWRVLERSHLVIQIVDARNPLFYYSEDLHRYAAGLSPPRPCLLLVNKADFLTEAQRAEWARHFRARNWECAFFSARREEERLAEEARLEKELGSEGEGEGPDGAVPAPAEGGEGEDDEDDDDDDDEADEAAETGSTEVVGSDGEAAAQGEDTATPAQESASASVAEPEVSRILTREELMARVWALAESKGVVPEEGERLCVGMVGFPNVGKSSVINVLLEVTAVSHSKARVGISSTPGKTKHFQTLVLDDRTMLCDCPGLVFPSFVATAADMVCAGVLPIDQLRDHLSPVDLVCRRVPRALLELYYGVTVRAEGEAGEGAPVTAADFLRAICQARSFMSQNSGVPDVNRAARIVLWDYVEGRVFFCHPPPELGPEAQDAFCVETNGTLMKATKIERRLRLRETAAAHAAPSGGEGAQGAEGTIDGGDEEDADDVEGVEGLASMAPGASGGKPRYRPPKKWGKKGKKLRDPTPYVEGLDDMLGEGGKGAWTARTTGRRGPSEGFTRVTMPHHPTYDGPPVDRKRTVSSATRGAAGVP